MKKLGKVVAIEKGRLILKTDKKVKKGDEIYDESKRFIGNIVGFRTEKGNNYAVVSTKKAPGPFKGGKLYG